MKSEFLFGFLNQRVLVFLDRLFHELSTVLDVVNVDWIDEKGIKN